MTPVEQQAVRHITAQLRLARERIRELEDENARLHNRIQHHRRLRKRTETMRRKAEDTARQLHARCIQHGIEP